jgi:hypothetical protein
MSRFRSRNDWIGLLQARRSPTQVGKTCKHGDDHQAMYERVDCTEKIIWGYKFRDGATYISLPMDVGVNRRASVGKPYQHSGARNLCNSKSNIRSNDWLVTKAFRRKWLDATKRHAITATVLPQSFESVVGAFVVRAGLLNSRSGSPRHPTLASSSRDAIKPWLTRVAA